MEKNKNTINVADELAKSISSRDSLVVLVRIIKSIRNKVVNLDFSKVEFISRSTAHELLKIQNDFNNKFFNKRINFVNTNKDVSEMLRIVAANLASPKAKKPTSKAGVVDIHSLLEDFG
ncbi:DUF4325 domain-containing protein [Patescibacteria group bacterium]|nr:DUF4325 domain-containing protein [Patescibacteria group bacterium]